MSGVFTSFLGIYVIYISKYWDLLNISADITGILPMRLVVMIISKDMNIKYKIEVNFNFLNNCPER